MELEIGGQKKNSEEALKFKPSSKRSRRREKICLEFCEVSCGRFGWAGSEAKINFGPGSQAGNLEKTNLEAMPDTGCSSLDNSPTTQSPFTPSKYITIQTI